LERAQFKPPNGIKYLYLLEDQEKVNASFQKESQSYPRDDF
jgi:hypothetical protein